jgi:hypothetical protein
VIVAPSSAGALRGGAHPWVFAIGLIYMYPQIALWLPKAISW